MCILLYSVVISFIKTKPLSSKNTISGYFVDAVDESIGYVNIARSVHCNAVGVFKFRLPASCHDSDNAIGVKLADAVVINYVS